MDVAAMLNISDFTDLNIVKEGRKEGNHDISDVRKHEKRTKVKGHDEIYVEESETSKEESDYEGIELFGEEEVYCCGEVGYWKDSGWDSQMRNARELRRDDSQLIEKKDEEAESHRYAVAEREGVPPGVPEEYDRSREGRRMGIVVSELREAEEAEVKEFGHIREYPTMRRPTSYRRAIMSSASGIPTWFAASKIELGEQLTVEQKEEAACLLYTWKDLFADQIRDMPVTDLLVHRIPVYQGAQPRRAKDRLYTKEERDWLELNIPKLEEAGIIARSESPWVHRTKFVRKKDGGLRMVHVFCPINSVTMLSGYPTKRIEPVLNNLMQAKFSSYFQADAVNGFWAIRMHPPHAYRTAFSTDEGLWQYLRMGQGLAGAPHTYARLKGLFSGTIPAPDPGPCLNRCTVGAFECFVDDDFGAFPSFAAQFDFLHNHYFPRLAWARITLKARKCGFFLDKINPLGFASDGSGLRPSLDKVRAIRDYPQPTTAVEIEAFLYMTIYLRQFIPGRAEHARILKEAIIYRPLHQHEKDRLVQPGRRGKPVKVACGLRWDEGQEKSFQAIKDAIIKNVVFGGDDSKQYHLMTDASVFALGGVLFQLPDLPAGTNLATSTRGGMKIVMFISKRFLPTETRYSTTEREALAILRCLEEVRWLVLGSPFPTKVYTDHQALVWLLRKDDTHGRIVRWQVRLAEYDVEYIHIPGRENALADGMSRMRWIGDGDKDAKTSTIHEVVAVETQQLADEWKEWLEDKWYGEVVYYKLFGHLDDYRDQDGEPLSAHRRRLIRHRSKPYRLLLYTVPIGVAVTGAKVPSASHYTTKPENRLVFVERNGKEAFCIRAREVETILYRMHDCHGHFAAGVLLRTIVGRYYWPTRAKDVNLYCVTCSSCQMVGPLKPSVSQMAIVHLQPLDMMGFDFVGRFPESPRGNKYIIIGVDYFSRYLFGKAVPDSQGKSAVALLTEVVNYFGWPRAVYTDNGAHFVSGAFAEVLRRFSVIHIPAPKAHPQSVGLAERYVKLLVDGLKVTVMGQKRQQEDWDLVVDSVVHAINTRVLSVHGFSPAELLLGFNPNRSGREVTPRAERAVATLSASACQGNDLWSKEEELAQRQLERLVRLDHIRAEAATKITAQAEKREENQRPARYTPPKAGDLVLLRRFLLDQRKGNKLEARWEGPYILSDISWHGKSGRLLDINTKQLVRVKKGALRNRVHLNDLKIYLPRRTEMADDVGMVDILEYEWRTSEGEQAKGHGIEQIGVKGKGDLAWLEEAQGVG